MTLYLFSASAYFIFMLFSKFSDQECSKTYFVSWLVIIFASALWIVTIPISLIEIRSKALAKVRIEEMEKAINYETDNQLIEPVESNSFDSNTLAQLTPKNI
jgi:hypothetical protein